MNNSSTSKGFVYIMMNGSGNCKVGHSINPEKRLSQLSCGDKSIKLMFVSDELSNRVDIESLCHRKLSAYSIKGEWFDVELEKAKEVVINAVADIGENTEEDTSWVFENKLLENKLLAVGYKAKIFASSDTGKAIIFSYMERISSPQNKAYRDMFLEKCEADQYLVACEFFTKLSLGFGE